jgi:two-component system, NtrC family, sensor kinase
MASTRKTAGKRAMATGRNRLRGHKSGGPKARRAAPRKPKLVKATPPKGKPSLASETARLKSRLKTARMQQHASAEILRAIANASGDAKRPLQQIAETTARLFAASAVSIRIAGPGDDWSHVINVGEGAKRIVAAVSTAQLKISGHNMPGAVYRENRQIHLPDIDNVDPEIADWPGLKPARAAGSRTISGSPLRRGDRAIGVLIIHRNRLAPFTEGELEVQQTFADQAVIAIENARLFNETQEALERQTATADVLKVISRSAFDLDMVLDTLVETVTRLCRADNAAMYRRRDDKHHLVASCGISEEAKEFFRSHPAARGRGTLSGRVELERRAVHIPDVLQDPEYTFREGQKVGEYRTLLGIPLLRGDELIGHFNLTRTRVEPFTNKETELATTFADQAVIAIENARLLNETREALERQTATAEILKVIASSPSDVQPVFEAIATSANRLLGGFSSTVFRLIDGMADLKAFTPTTPEADEILQSTFPRPAADFLPFRMAQAGEVMQIPDTETLSDEIGNIARARGFRSMLFAPLMNKGASIGFIAVTRLETGAFTDHHVQLLKTFADQAVIAIENARLFDELQARTRDLAKSLDDLRNAQDRLIQTEKLASLGQLTAGIAHEIKNPLNFVNNFSALSTELIDELSDVLESTSLGGKPRQEVDEITKTLKANLEKVVQHGKRADSIVKNMLLHSREGSGERRSADINAIVEESLNLAYHGARAEKSGFNITLKRDLDPAAGMIDLYPQEISRVLLNLISNGFYAASKRHEMGENGFEPTLAATTKNLGKNVEIRIRDNGTGIPAEVREKMFNPFFTTKPAGEGTGLGLSMSHDIVVKQHGGTIDVETQPGAFTEFIITLPRILAAQKILEA